MNTRFFLLTTLLTTLVFSAAAEAKPVESHPDCQRCQVRAERRAKVIERFDADGNGELTGDERKQARKARRKHRMKKRMLEQFDANADGVLDDDEKQAARESRKQRRKERRKERRETRTGNANQV